LFIVIGITFLGTFEPTSGDFVGKLPVPDAPSGQALDRILGVLQVDQLLHELRLLELLRRRGRDRGCHLRHSLQDDVMALIKHKIQTFNLNYDLINYFNDLISN